MTLILSTYDDDSAEEDTGNENEVKFHHGQVNESSYFDKVKLIAYIECQVPFYSMASNSCVLSVEGRD